MSKYKEERAKLNEKIDKTLGKIKDLLDEDD